jgi:hypothetical protein
MDGCIAYQNGAYGFWAGAKGSAVVFNACHGWGNAQSVAFLLDGSGCILNGCEGEGASAAQVIMRASDCQINGGSYFAAGGGAGIQIGQTSSSSVVAGYMIRTKLLNFAAGQAIVYDDDAGLGWIELLIYHASGAVGSGTPHASSKRDIRVFGGGTGTIDV